MPASASTPRVLNSGFAFPRKRVTANLAPAATARSAPAFDLVLACCVLAAQEELDAARLARVGLFAELGLGGDLRHCEGVAAAAEAAEQARSRGADRRPRRPARGARRRFAADRRPLQPARRGVIARDRPRADGPAGDPRALERALRRVRSERSRRRAGRARRLRRGGEADPKRLSRRSAVARGRCARSVSASAARGNGARAPRAASVRAAPGCLRCLR